MQLYYLGPRIEAGLTQLAEDAVTRAAIEPIVDIVLGYFRLDGFDALVGLEALNAPDAAMAIGERRGPIPPYPPLESGQRRFGRYRITSFDSEGQVRAALKLMGDPFAIEPPGCFMIRSLISCRAVFYGYDGQAFLCLRTTDEPPVAPDPALILVEARPDLLLESDYLDGAKAAEEW